MASAHLSIGQRVEHWLHTYSRLRKAQAERSERERERDARTDESLVQPANWRTLADGFKMDRLKATREFLSRQQYYRTVRQVDTGEWVQSEPVETAPSLDLDDLYARLDSSISAEGLTTEGLTLTLVVIDENGTPREATIQESEHRLLNTKALYTAMRTRFVPAYHYGIPVGTMVLVPLYFRNPLEFLF